MKIIDFKIFTVANPPPAYGGPCWTFIQLTTSDGVCGIGEIYSVPFAPSVVRQMAADLCERRVVGIQPQRIETLWRQIYSDVYTQRPDISTMGILSAIEMACWDIIGKAHNKPVYDLLGGRVRERVRTYTYLYPAADDATATQVYEDPTAAAARAAEYIAAGFTAVKFDPAGPYTAYDPRQLSLHDLDRSEAFVREIRAAIGNRGDILFGTHGQMTPDSAIRLARRLAPYDPLWLEEPTPPDYPDGMAKVAHATTIPIAAGERLTTKYEFATLLRQQCAAILQMNLGRVGGLLEAKKIAGMAEAFHVQVAPHMYCGPVVAAANLQLAACTPNFLILECIQKMDGFHAQLVKKPVQWEDGYIVLDDTAAGLGVEIDEATAAAHADTSDSLHLNPLPHEHQPYRQQP